MTTTEKAAARSADSPAVRRGDARLGDVVPADADDAARFRALAAIARLDADEEGGLRLVPALQPVPAHVCQRLVALLGGGRRGVTRAVDAFVGAHA